MSTVEDEIKSEISHSNNETVAQVVVHTDQNNTCSKNETKNDEDVKVQDNSRARFKITHKSNLDDIEEDPTQQTEKPSSVMVTINLREIDKHTFKIQEGDLKSAYIGMGKEELMKYANDPFWVRLRWFLFISFWLLWAGMLVGAVVIICVAPKCDPPPPKTWFEVGPLTEVNIDVTEEQLNKLKKQNIPGVIMNWPEDAYKVLPDSHELLDKLNITKSLGLNVIIDLKPGVSKLWFEQSEGKVDNFTDYYIWKAPNGTDTSGPIPPNNWKIPKNESAWRFSDTRKEFYYLSPDEEPLLNFRNPNVVELFSQVIKRFLEKGVNGVRLRQAPYLLVDSNFEKEDISSIPGTIHTEYNFYTHKKTRDIPELSTILHTWRKIVKSKVENGPFMIDEEFDIIKIGSYSINNSLVIDLPMQSHIFNQSTLDVTRIVQNLNAIKENSINWPLWTHKTDAVPSDVLDIVTLLMPGTLLVEKEHVVNQELLNVRKSPSVLRGSFNFTEVANRTCLAYIREWETNGNPGILVALNPTNKTVIVDFVKEIPAVSDEVTIQLFSNNYNETDFSVNAKKSADNIPLSPFSSIVLSYVPKKKDD